MESFVDGRLDPELFAEMIVRDCSRVVEYYDKEHPRHIAYLIERRYNIFNEEE
jgi:hypothetical protein